MPIVDLMSEASYLVAGVLLGVVLRDIRDAIRSDPEEAPDARCQTSPSAE